MIHDPDAKLLIMVMEFMPGGPLLSSTGHGNTEPIPEAAARGYFRCDTMTGDAAVCCACVIVAISIDELAFAIASCSRSGSGCFHAVVRMLLASLLQRSPAVHWVASAYLTPAAGS